jgi:hypothetical protein
MQARVGDFETKRELTAITKTAASPPCETLTYCYSPLIDTDILSFASLMQAQSTYRVEIVERLLL